MTTATNDLPAPGASPAPEGTVGGPADGPVARPRGLSPSRAADFLRCPLLYRFRTIDKLPEAPSPAAVRGTLVHAVLERLFDLPAAERTPTSACGMVEDQWRALLEREPRTRDLFGPDPEQVPERAAALATWLDSARRLLERYFELEDPTRLEPAGRELELEVLLQDGLVLRGIVDRLDETPSGDLRVVDYKTGRAPSELHEAGAMFQMRFYALVLWRMRGVVPRLLQLVYLGSGDVLRYAPDEADLLATERKVRALWEAIETARATGDWRPRPGRTCSWCDHQALCPAFGGTPPPLPV